MAFDINIPKHIRQNPGFGNLYEKRAPESAEKHEYTGFHKIDKIKSVFVPGAEVDDPTTARTECPRCSTELPALDHGDYCKCHECGLQMELFGNGLALWE